MKSAHVKVISIPLLLIFISSSLYPDYAWALRPKATEARSPVARRLLSRLTEVGIPGIGKTRSVGADSTSIDREKIRPPAGQKSSSAARKVSGPHSTSVMNRKIERLKERIKKRYFMYSEEEAIFDGSFKRLVADYGAEDILELARLNLRLVKVLILDKRVRGLLNRFGIKVFFRIAKLDPIYEIEEVITNVATFTSPKDSQELFSYTKAFAKIYSYMPNLRISKEGKHLPVYRYIIRRHSIDILVRLARVVDSRMNYFYIYSNDKDSRLAEIRVGMIEFLNRIKGSKEELLDFIKILNFIAKKYYYRRYRPTTMYKSEVFAERKMENLLFLLEYGRPSQALRLFRFMGVLETNELLYSIDEYLKELIKENGIEPFIEIAEAAGKKEAKWHRYIGYGLKNIVEEFGLELLIKVAKKAEGSTGAMFEAGIPLAMRYMERDRKDRKEKFLRYALALAESVSKIDNSRARAILLDGNKIFEQLVVRKGKTPDKIEKELSGWTEFLIKLTRGSKERLSKIGPLLDFVTRFGKEPFLKVVRRYRKRADAILVGFDVLRQFIKKEEDLYYYAEKLDKIGELSKNPMDVVNAMKYGKEHIIPFIRKFGIERILELAEAAKDNTEIIILYTLSALIDLIKDEEDFGKFLIIIGRIKEDLAEKARAVFWTAIPEIRYLLKSIEDLEDYRPALVEIRKASKDYGDTIFGSIRLYKRRIGSKQDLLNYLLPLARVAGYCGDHTYTVLRDCLADMLKIEPDAIEKICFLIDNRIPPSNPDVFNRYAQNIILAIATCSRFGINGFGLVEGLLKKKRSLALSELAAYVDTAKRFDKRVERIANFINGLLDSNAKYELLRRLWRQLDAFYTKDTSGYGETAPSSEETKEFFKGLNRMVRLEGEEILLKLLSLNLDKLRVLIGSLPLKKEETTPLKRLIRPRVLLKTYQDTLKAAFRKRPDFHMIWRMIKDYNVKVKALVEDVEKSPQVKALYDRIGYLNRKTGQLRREIGKAKRARNTRKRRRLEEDLEQALNELKELSQATKRINKIKSLLDIPFQSLINKHTHSRDLKEYKKALKDMLLKAKIQLIQIYLIRIRNRIYEAVVGGPILKEVKVSAMVDKVANIWYGLKGQVIVTELAKLLSLYINGADPDKIVGFIYPERIVEKLREAGYNPEPFIRGCSLGYDTAIVLDFISRKKERLRDHFREFLEHIRELNIDLERILSDLGITEPKTYQDAEAIHKALMTRLDERGGLKPKLKDILNDIKIHLNAIKSIEVETEKKQNGEGVEYYISLDPVEKMHMGVGLFSCMDIERRASTFPLVIGLSWDKPIAYVRDESKDRIARRLLVLTDKAIIAYNEFSNTQLDLDYGWVKFLQKLADESGKNVIIPEVEKISSSLKRVLKEYGIEKFENFTTKFLDDYYGHYFYDDLKIVSGSEFFIKSGYIIKSRRLKKVKAAEDRKRRVSFKATRAGEGYRFLTDPLYRAALVNSMSSLMVKAHDLGIKTVLANGISAEPAAQFFKFCWEKVYPAEEPPRIEFLGEAAGQIGGHRYDRKAVAAKIAGFSDREKMLRSPILVLDDVYFMGYTLDKTQELLTLDFKAKKAYTAVLFRWCGKQDRLARDIVRHPDLPALRIGPQVYFLGSNWYLTRAHTIRADTTGEFRQTPERLKEIFEEDLPYDLKMLSSKVYERIKRQRAKPQGPNYSLLQRIDSSA